MAEDILLKHREAYLREAHAHVQTMNANLLVLEKSPQDSKALHEIFRGAHTLKSNAATMNYHQTANLCHVLEDLLDAIRSQKIELNKCINLLFQSFDYLSENIKEISQNNTEIESETLINQIKESISNPQKQIAYSKSEQKIVASAIEKIHAIEVSVERLDTLVKLVEELLVNRLKLDALTETINNPDLTATVERLGRLVTDMQYNIMQARLLPIKFIFNRFPRMVRDLAQSQQKDVELKIEGGDIELDRTLLDELAESLGHLIRNAIDHGIETKEVREKAHKNPQGTIRLIATRTKEFVTIEVSDDGSGLDFDAIKKAAIKLNLLKEDSNIEDLSNFIFEGLSTAKEVTELSGRGLGLGIVKKKIESIGGTIRVESHPNQGVTFFIQIPLTLAVIKVLFTKVGEKIYAIPLDNIERLLTVEEQEFKGLLNYNAIIYENENIPITHLAKIFGTSISEFKRYPIVVVRNNENKMGIAVDQLLSTQEVVIKPLSKVIKKSKLFSGSALIGSGEIVLILDIFHLFLSKNEIQPRRLSNANR